MVSVCVVIATQVSDQPAIKKIVKDELRKRYGENIAICWHPVANNDIRDVIAEMCNNPSIIICCDAHIPTILELDCCEIEGAGIIAVTSSDTSGHPERWMHVPDHSQIPSILIAALDSVLDLPA